MLKRCIIAENRKLHASPIWVMFFLLPIISAGYGTFNYLQNLEILKDKWYSLWSQHTLFYSIFFFPAMVASRLCGIPLAPGTSGSQLEHHHGKPGETAGSVCSKICRRSKTGSADTRICISVIHILWQNIRPSPRMAADRTAILPLTRRSGSPRSHRRSTRPVYAYQKFRPPGIPRPDRRNLRHFRQLQRPRPALALLPDAGRHERQQKQRCTGRRIRIIHCQLRDLVDRAVHPGRRSSEEKRRPGIKNTTALL